MRKKWIPLAAALALLAGAAQAGAAATADAKATPVPSASAAQGKAPTAKPPATAKKKLVNLNAASRGGTEGPAGGQRRGGRPHHRRASLQQQGVPRHQQGHQRGALLRDQVPGRGRRAGEGGRAQEVSAGPGSESTNVNQGSRGGAQPALPRGNSEAMSSPDKEGRWRRRRDSNPPRPRARREAQREMAPYRPLKSHDLATDLATLRDLESVPIRVGVDLDDDFLDGDGRGLAAADRLHRDETGGLHLRQRAREVGLRPPAHLHELGNRLWLAIANDGEKLPVLRGQQAHHGIDRIEARLPASAGAGRSPRATAFISSRNERRF